MDTTATKWTGARARLGSRHFDLPSRAKKAGVLLDRMRTPIVGDETVVDAGAGSGLLTLAVADRLETGVAIAVELSPDMLARLRKRTTDAGLDERVVPVQADAADTGLDDATADLVVSSFLLHELFDTTAAFAEWVRILKPGGQLLLHDVGAGWHSFIVRRMHDARAHGPFSGAELAAALEEAGLVDVEVKRGGRLLTATARKPAKT